MSPGQSSAAENGAGSSGAGRKNLDEAITGVPARYWAFEADGRPHDALASYQQIYDDHPMCEQASSALFAAARIMADQGKREHACERLEQLVRQYTEFEHRDGVL